jgi:hypothetical protein
MTSMSDSKNIICNNTNKSNVKKPWYFFEYKNINYSDSDSELDLDCEECGLYNCMCIEIKEEEGYKLNKNQKFECIECREELKNCYCRRYDYVETTCSDCLKCPCVCDEIDREHGF